MNTKLIKIATFVLTIGLGLIAHSAFSDDSGSAAAGIQLSSLTTLSGTVYREVDVISADNAGLLFRHSRGTAKVDFSNLSKNLREMFETAPTPVAANADPVVDEGLAEDDGAYQTLEIESRTRIVITHPAHHGCRSRCCNPFDPRTVNWRPHWGRYHYGLSYANFYCRQAAERDLLIRSGFLR